MLHCSVTSDMALELFSQSGGADKAAAAGPGLGVRRWSGMEVPADRGLGWVWEDQKLKRFH